MWNRNNDPHNSEELMIAEYYRRVEENKELTAKIEEERIAANANYDELMELLQAEEAKTAHLQSVLDKDEGIIDLQEPILLYKSNVGSEYDFKRWLEDYADDEGAGEGMNGLITALSSSDDACIQWCKDHSSSYRTLVKTVQRVFKFTLKVPVFGTFAYDPEYNKTQLITLSKKYADEQWVNMPLEEFKKYTAMKIREVANQAIRRYKDDLAEQAKEQATS